MLAEHYTLYPVHAKRGSPNDPVNVCCVTSTLHTQHRQSHLSMSPPTYICLRVYLPTIKVMVFITSYGVPFSHAHMAKLQTSNERASPPMLFTHFQWSYICMYIAGNGQHSLAQQWKKCKPSVLLCSHSDSNSSNASDVYNRYGSNGDSGMYLRSFTITETLLSRYPL